jgi:hypothetical protein
MPRKIKTYETPHTLHQDVSNYRLFKNGSKVDLIFYNNKNELYNIYLRFTKNSI